MCVCVCVCVCVRVRVIKSVDEITVWRRAGKGEDARQQVQQGEMKHLVRSRAHKQPRSCGFTDRRRWFD